MGATSSSSVCHTVRKTLNGSSPFGRLVGSDRDTATAVAALTVEGLEKVYDGTVALRGLDLRVPAGAFYGLLGPNGSGKTTLIGMITGLVRAPRGHIRIFGHDAVADQRSAKLRVGLAPQEVHPDRFLSVRQVRSYHRRYFGMAPPKQRSAEQLLGAFDLASKAGSRPNRPLGRHALTPSDRARPRPSSTSGDQILDEPTVGVDLALRHELRSVSRRGTLALAGREVRRVLRLCPDDPARGGDDGLFLAIFGGALGDRLQQVEGVSYLSFILPGLS